MSGRKTIKANVATTSLRKKERTKNNKNIGKNDMRGKDVKKQRLKRNPRNHLFDEKERQLNCKPRNRLSGSSSFSSSQTLSSTSSFASLSSTESLSFGSSIESLTSNTYDSIDSDGTASFTSEKSSSQSSALSDVASIGKQKRKRKNVYRITNKIRQSAVSSSASSLSSSSASSSSSSSPRRRNSDAYSTDSLEKLRETFSTKKRVKEQDSTNATSFNNLGNLHKRLIRAKREIKKLQSKLKEEGRPSARDETKSRQGNNIRKFNESKGEQRDNAEGYATDAKLGYATKNRLNKNHQNPIINNEEQCSNSSSTSRSSSSVRPPDVEKFFVPGWAAGSVNNPKNRNINCGVKSTSDTRSNTKSTLYILQNHQWDDVVKKNYGFDRNDWQCLQDAASKHKFEDNVILAIGLRYDGNTMTRKEPPHDFDNERPSVIDKKMRKKLLLCFHPDKHRGREPSLMKVYEILFRKINNMSQFCNFASVNTTAV